MDEYDNPLQEHHYDDGYEPIMDLESIESLHQEVEPELDAFSDVNSEYMKLPLPEGIDDHEDSLEYEPIAFQVTIVKHFQKTPSSQKMLIAFVE